MVHEHLSHLKLDRRMLRRRQWVKDPEVKQALEQLPDVSEKAETVGMEEGEEAASDAETTTVA